MNPTSNKSDFEDLTTNLRDLAYSYLEKYNPSKQQLKVYLLKKYSKSAANSGALAIETTVPIATPDKRIEL